MFAASGLFIWSTIFLVKRPHCAGRVQTSFDLLGELGKGNAGVVLDCSSPDEERFRNQ
jgi:hypothetical protein